MAKVKTTYTCSACGHTESKWSGQCSSCGEWNTFEKKTVSASGTSASSAFFKGSGVLTTLADVKAEDSHRYDSGFKEVNQVLGGGIVPGAAMLFSGEPGIGKSTLLLQICQRFGRQGKILYVSGEESPGQIKLRANRLGIDAAIALYTGTDLDAILQAIKKEFPRLLIVDSAQTLYSGEAGMIPGTVNQVRRCAHEVIGLCKEMNIACFMVTHVTKDGSIAGPKAIEHLVDTVLYFEQGDHEVRILRAIKNRFGAVDELGLFIMGEQGLKELTEKEQAQFFHRNVSAGAVIACAYEGSRVFFHEIQALTVPAKSGMSRVYSERIDASRALRIAAVLEKHVGLKFSDQDVYVNVSGGIRLTEPGIDLPLALALYSARTNIAFPSVVSAGEIALSGEIRPALHMGKRIKSAQDLGFEIFSGTGIEKSQDIKVLAAAQLKDVIAQVLAECNKVTL